MNKQKKNMLYITILATVMMKITSSEADDDDTKPRTIFNDRQVIFSTKMNITRLLVPAGGYRYISTESSEMPSVFFTVRNPAFVGGTCIYIFEGLAAFEVLEGGRDSSSDLNNDRSIYFGARNGLYKYNPESFSAKKYGPFRDDILQIQKATRIDAIYTLNADHKLYKYEKNGTVKSSIRSVDCATDFVLDTSNNIYYISCSDKITHILKPDGSLMTLETNYAEDLKNIKLIRPAFVMEECIPLFADGDFYVLHSNGTLDKKDFHINERPAAFSIDAGLYIVASIGGKIYEFNVMDLLVKSMFNLISDWPSDANKLIMSVIDNFRLD